MRDNRPALAFYLFNGSIAIYRHHQIVTLGLGIRKVFDVAIMQDIKTAVGKNYPFTLTSKALGLARQARELNYFFAASRLAAMNASISG